MATKYYNVNDGPTGRSGGPYLDREEAAAAEVERAAKEGGRTASSTLVPYSGIQLDTGRGMLFRQPVEATRIVSDSDADGAISAPVVADV